MNSKLDNNLAYIIELYKVIWNRPVYSIKEDIQNKKIRKFILEETKLIIFIAFVQESDAPSWVNTHYEMIDILRKFI